MINVDKDILYTTIVPFLMGVLITAVPLAYLCGRLTIISEREQFRLAAIECINVAKEQRQALEAAIKN